jgi:hypothetical protein
LRYACNAERTVAIAARIAADSFQPTLRLSLRLANSAVDTTR